MRGANEGDKGVDWMRGGAADLIDAGSAALAQGDAEGAIANFTEALDFADDAELPELYYLLAWSYSSQGDIEHALLNLDQTVPRDTGWFGPDYYLLKARLLVESSAFQEAADLLSSHADVFAGDPISLQTAGLLAGLANEGLGDDTSATTALQGAVAIDPGTNVGKAAQRLLDSAALPAAAEREQSD